MVGRIIRKIGKHFYDHPKIEEDALVHGPFAKLRIAAVTDHFTADCLSVECRVRHLTPANYREVLDHWKPDLVFVESAFHGKDGAWRYELARQPRWLRLTKPRAIFHLVDHARARGIPTVFWNKDDGAYFDAFIHVAKACDVVFTTDEDCLPRYREHLPAGVPAQVLMMPFQPRFHAFDGHHPQHQAGCFVGSYYLNILDERRRFLDMMFAATGQCDMPLHVFDRNHGRLSRHLDFRFPKHPHLQMFPKVAHRTTGQVYKDHTYSLNVNSVTGSQTMVSRRLLEVLACGGVLVTNGSRAVSAHFQEYCHVVESHEQAVELLSRLKQGASADDLQRAEAGARYVLQHHTWGHRLEQVCAAIGKGSP